MTLVELLVVLALLVVVGSIVVPVFTGSFSSIRLRRAGDQVLTRWSQARARAIETGEVYQFTYTPETGSYQVGPWVAVVDETTAGGSTASHSTPAASTATTAAASAADGDGSTSVEDPTTGQSVNLPGTITFQSGQIAVDDAMATEKQVASMQSTGQSVSTPILFFPDGTTSEASIVLANDRNQFIRISLRGLTGVGRATEVLSREGIQQATRRR